MHSPQQGARVLTMRVVAMSRHALAQPSGSHPNKTPVHGSVQMLRAGRVGGACVGGADVVDTDTDEVTQDSDVQSAASMAAARCGPAHMPQCEPVSGRGGSGGRGGAGHHIRVCRDMIAAVPLRTESQPKCLYAFFGIINIIIHQWNNAPNDRCGVRPVTGTAHAQRNSMPLYRAGGRHLRPALPASGGVYSACTDHCIGLGIFGESDLCAEDTTRWWDAGLDHTSATDMFHKARRRMWEGARTWDPGTW